MSAPKQHGNPIPHDEPVVVIVGSLTFIPALALGPIVEHLHLHS